MAAPSSDLLTHLHDPLNAAVASASSSVLLCSPFVGAGVAATLASTAGRRPQLDWRLLTALSPRAAAHGSLSIDGLRALRGAGVVLKHLPALHAKLFLIDNAVGFAGSANLTSSGLGADARSNHELTVRLNDHQLPLARQQFEDWWGRGVTITPTMLNACEREARQLKVSLSGVAGAADPEVVRFADALLAQAPDVRCWIKGEYRDEYDADVPRSERPWVASPPRGPGKPRFSTGDLLLLYAQLAGKANVVVEVTGPTTRDPDFLRTQGIPEDDVVRWPWVTPVTPRLQVPIVDGVPLARLGLVGQSLRRGHRRMPTGGLATALRYMCRLPIPDE